MDTAGNDAEASYGLSEQKLFIFCFSETDSCDDA